MALPPLRDLEDWRDVKGGSPRSPSAGIPVAEYQQYAQQPITVGNHVVLWKMLATSGWSLMFGTLLAWWSAWQAKGISAKDMQDYVKEYERDSSPYAQQKDVLAAHNAQQDQQIGALLATQALNIQKLNTHDNRFYDVEHNITDLQSKNKQFGDFIEGLRKAKK